MSVRVQHLQREGFAAAQHAVAAFHYLRKPVDPRSTPEAFGVYVPAAAEPVGFLIVGRPEATRCYVPAPAAVRAAWAAARALYRAERRHYGDAHSRRGLRLAIRRETRARVARLRAAVTRWQVLNLARVWLSPRVQPGGDLHDPRCLPGFTDRAGTWKSRLASAAIRALADRVVFDYLAARPPCFLDEPYELRWLLSYCDTRQHHGTVYRAAGFELYSTNRQGLATYRLPLRRLRPHEDAGVRADAAVHPRSVAHRARRGQLGLALEAA
jgi:hypothetical protein